jgi:hypothetical protein
MRKYNLAMSDSTFNYWKARTPHAILDNGLWRPLIVKLIPYHRFFRKVFPKVGELVIVDGAIYRLVFVNGDRGIVVPNCSSKPETKDSPFVQFSRNPDHAIVHIGDAHFHARRIKLDTGEWQEDE